jgi:hypothetical protein
MATFFLSTEIADVITFRLADGTDLPIEPVAGAPGSGITQLTKDVLAGPGSGSQPATLVQFSGPGAGAPVAGKTGISFAAGVGLIDCPGSELDLGSTSGLTVIDATGGVFVGSAHATSVTVGTSSPNNTATSIDAPGPAGVVQIGLSTPTVNIGGAATTSDLDGASVSVGRNTATSVTIGSSGACASSTIDAPAGTVGIGAGTGTTAIDAGIAPSALNVGTATDNVTIGGIGPSAVSTNILMPPLGPGGGGGGVVQADPTTGLLGTTGFRIDVVDSGLNVAVPAGPGQIVTAIIPIVAGTVLQCLVQVRDLTPGETVSDGAAPPPNATINVWGEQFGGGFQFVIGNASGGGARHVDYKVLRFS